MGQDNVYVHQWGDAHSHIILHNAYSSVGGSKQCQQK